MKQPRKDDDTEVGSRIKDLVEGCVTSSIHPLETTRLFDFEPGEDLRNSKPSANLPTKVG